MSVVSTPKMCRLCVAYSSGECRLNPPGVIGFAVATGKEPPAPVFGFPKVQGNDHCLQFRPSVGLEEKSP